MVARICRLTFGTLLAFMMIATPARVPAQAQTGELQVLLRYPDDLKGTPVMATAVTSNGKIAAQQEGSGFDIRLRPLPVGTYEVRLQGQGIETVVKSGIAVLQDRNTSIVGEIKRGQGLRVIEYSTLSLNELQSRLEKLEKSVADLEKRK